MKFVDSNACVVCNACFARFGESCMDCVCMHSVFLDVQVVVSTVVIMYVDVLCSI